MIKILYLGLRTESLDLLQNYFHAKAVVFQQVTEPHFAEVGKTLSGFEVFLIGEQVENPILFAQQASTHDKSISILLITEGINHEKIKRALQFSPFIGPAVQCISNDIGSRMLPIVEDALQRTAQRRSFAKLKSAVIAEQRFVPNVLERVREDFTTKVLQEAPIGIALLSDNATVYSINNFALSLFAKSEKEVLGIGVYNLFPAPGLAEVKGFLLDGYLSNPKKIFEIISPKGLQYLELTVTPINLKASSGFKLLLLNNITPAIIAQQRTEAHLEELKTLNASLTRTNADLDTFVYAASHDLKAPILNIEGLVTLLEEELGPVHPISQELEQIKKSIHNFKQTVEELTEVSRIQKGFEQEASQINIVALLEEVKQLLNKEIAETGAVITFLIEGNSKVYFSKKYMTSILYNLVGNAIKYCSPDRKPYIQIKFWEKGEEYRLSIQDNGLGIPAAKLDQVFNLFQRMHSHVSGSGVGLYIVKRIIENNGGYITVESQEGQGSIFQISLKKG